MIRYLLITVFLLATITCRERYDPQYIMPETGFLVVEGFINTKGRTIIDLSRTSQLAEKKMVSELNAVVRIEGEDNSFYPLIGSDTGRYVSEELQLNNTTKYRLHIKTQLNKEYVSEFKVQLKTPEINSLTWERTNGGVEIFVNAYDPLNETKYYKWDYEETWEFHSWYQAYLEINLIPGGNPDPTVILGWIDSTTFGWDSARYFCWKSRISTAILVGTTVKLSDNKVFIPLTYHPKDAWELSSLYSINVKQTGISKEGFELYEKMKKNTESLGSVFDPLPSEINGNVRSLANPAEPVIGFVDVTSQTEKRLFISVKELPGWNYYEYCSDSAVSNTREDLLGAVYNGFFATRVEDYDYDNGGIGSVAVAPKRCVDCKLRGTNIKPSFWPW